MFVPIPLLAWGAFALIAAVFGGAVAYQYAVGRTVLLVGPQRAGKTTLRKFLQDGVIEMDYVRTTLSETSDVKVQDQDLKSYKLKIVDVDGNKDQYLEWKNKTADADCICFLVDASRLDDGDYARDASVRATQVARWRPEGVVRILVVTHTDEVDGIYEGSEARHHPQVLKLERNFNPSRVLAVNLLDVEGMQHTVWSILGALNEPH